MAKDKKKKRNKLKTFFKSCCHFHCMLPDLCRKLRFDDDDEAESGLAIHKLRSRPYWMGAKFFPKIFYFLVYKLLLSVLMGEGQRFRIGKPADGRSWDCPKTNSEKKEGRT